MSRDQLQQYLNDITRLKSPFKREGMRWSGLEELILDPTVKTHESRTQEPSPKHKPLFDFLYEHPEVCMPQACFRNAALVTLTFELQYVEGYAMFEKLPIPIHHAWNLLPDGTPIDCTWCGSASEVQAGITDYVGVLIPDEFLLKMVREERPMGVFEWPTIIEILGNPPSWLFR